MGRLPKHWPVALIGSLAIVIGFGLLALGLYLRTEKAVVARHSQDQQLLAELAATALIQRVDSYLHRAERLAVTLQTVPERHRSQALAQLTPLAPGATSFLLGPTGIVSLQDPLPDPAALERSVLPWLGAEEPVLTNPFPGRQGPRTVALLVPLGSEGKRGGQLGVTIAFDPLVETLFAGRGASDPISLSLLDEQGTVLVNTRHPEMLGRRIPEGEKSCLPCHSSFHLERRMLAGEAGVGQLQVGQEPLALVAFTRVEFLGRRWSLSLAEPYSAITADTRAGFRTITLLLGLCLLVGLGATSLSLQYRVQRRRAEERAQLAERRSALERQLQHNQQLAAIGKMTSQIAHQINTPLATLGLNVSYLQGEVARRLGGSNPEIEEVGSAIAAEIERLKHVVNDYLRFSRFPLPVLEEESLRDLVESFLEFIESEARERRVQVDADLGRDSSRARLDADLFRQAFLNLVRNSFEAMPDGGRLQVRLGREGEEWVLSISDTGRGVPPDVLPRVFDPFFTTKKEGTGLGLAHVRRVVEEHGGRIECRSQVGEGTTFRIHLPVVSSEPTAPEELWVTSQGR